MQKAKKGLIFLLLVGVVAASFWVSYLLGKRILVPLKEPRVAEIELADIEPPPSIAKLQEAEEGLKVDQPEKTKVDEQKAEKPKDEKTEKQKTSRPVTSKPTTGKHFYKVQAGIFSSKQNAYSLGDKLKAEGFGVYIKKISDRYRVQAGAFYSRKEAVALQNSLQKKDFESTIIYE